MTRARGVDPSDAQQGFLGDLAQAAPLAILLDDLHAVDDGESLELLEYALEHLPPGVRLIAGSRADPRFSSRASEAAVFSASFVPPSWRSPRRRPGSSSSDRKDSISATRRWPSSSSAPKGGRSRSIWRRSGCARKTIRGGTHGFAGSQRYVAEYLTDEVLSRPDAATREFLVRTSVFDRFCAPLCDEVLRFDNSRALLAEMSKSNLLLEPLDDNGDWFRLHHLLDELLTLELDRTEAASVPELHRRAAAWFRARDLPEEAVEHALAAKRRRSGRGDPRRRLAQLLRRSEGGTLVRLVERLSAEAVLAHPALVAGSALATIGIRAPADERERWLSIAGSSSESPGPGPPRAEMAVAMTRALAIDGDVGGAAGHAQRAMSSRRNRTRRAQVLAFAALAWALYCEERRGGFPAASRAVASINAPSAPTASCARSAPSRLSPPTRVARTRRLRERARDRARSHAAFTSAASVATAHLARSRALAARGRLREAGAAAEHGELLSRAPDRVSRMRTHCSCSRSPGSSWAHGARPKRRCVTPLGEIKTFADPGQLPSYWPPV